MFNHSILTGDSLHMMQELEDDSIDLIVTDPPYGYSFMGKDWDKAVPSVEIWQECLRVLKPGAFCFVMSAPRSDVQNAMISRLMEAGFRLDFTPIYWTYASGFPKAGNIGKLVDKRLGNEREQVTGGRIAGTLGSNTMDGGKANPAYKYTVGTTELEGSYAGFQPKPAVEVIIVAMKPLSEKTYVDQALKNGKGITWLDDCRVPTGENLNGGAYSGGQRSDGDWKDSSGFKNDKLETFEQPQGRFPANLLVSDDVLNDHTRFFNLDEWAATLPFLAVPKASKSEKNRGLDGFEKQEPNYTKTYRPTAKDSGDKGQNTPYAGTNRGGQMKNGHPTVKPLKLMSYLITLGSREGDTILDPFVGSGTTIIASKQLGRNGIGIEREEEYAEIARARLEAVHKPIPQLPKEKPEPGQPPVTIEDIIQTRLFADV